MNINHQLPRYIHVYKKKTDDREILGEGERPFKIDGKGGDYKEGGKSREDNNS
jgi:hypothetical protein